MSNRAKVLIVVDMQAGFMTESNQHIYNAINRLDFHAYEYIFATKFQNIKSKNANYFDILHYNFMTQDSETQILLPEDLKYIEVKKSSYGLPKASLSKIISIYKASSSKEVHIIGTDYDSCVLAIGFQLFDAGLQPRFYRNMIGSHSVDKIELDEFEKVYKKNFGNDCFIQ